jgi:hypothetical protein
MRKERTFLVAMILIGLSSCAQELTCSDFHLGEFYIPTTEELKNFKIIMNDSIQNFELQLDSTVSKTVIERKKNTQTEWVNEIGNGQPAYEILEWIDDCSYRLTYDDSKMDLDDMEKWINENNGIIVSKRTIENNCLFYTATMTTNSGEKLSQSGVICKK